MRDPRPRAARRGRRSVQRLAQLLVCAGTAALVWCALVVADGVLAQRTAREALQTALPAETPSNTAALGELEEFEETAALSAPNPTVPSAPVPIAELSIPRVDLSAAVLHGSDARTLRHGPGHLEHSAYPGDGGNVVIAGHRDSFFWPLRNIQVGDDVMLETPGARFHYRVTSVRVVKPREVSVLAPTREEVLTLITCYPFWVFGRAPDRLVVRAQLVNAPSNALLDGRTLPVLEASAAPTVLPAAAAILPVVSVAPATLSDETQVRLALARYLGLHGVHLAGRSDAAVDEPRTVQCEVTFDETEATAGCTPTRAASGTGEPRARTFTLAQLDDAWAITSIALNE